MGRLNPGDESAVAALERLVQHPQPFRERVKAITSLIAIDSQNSVIISVLTEIANADLSASELRDFVNVVWAFREIAIENETVTGAVAELINRWQYQILSRSQEECSFN
ncbi:hypothetical protein [Leptolyngbya sp. FACHB-17]|uniref:hypothetical protein n=1 Tax=unclassified Leptolyngbya TaxID=2650499 RepID=UPI001680D0C0|nr:hypothetical protein [Leptolyngbya sp. FACHB-17]MBD2079268.1 hypothetical protein [Leptolyngbya sp. FACHB-17]